MSNALLYNWIDRGPTQQGWYVVIVNVPGVAHVTRNFAIWNGGAWTGSYLVTGRIMAFKGPFASMLAAEAWAKEHDPAP